MKCDLLPYNSEVVTPRLSALIESAKQRGELVDTNGRVPEGYVTNTSSYQAKEIIQLYVRDKKGTVINFHEKNVI